MLGMLGSASRSGIEDVMAELSITEAVNRAEEAIETGNYDRAIETCERILGEMPEFATAYRLMGEARLENGDFEEAKVAFQRTLERDPQSIQAHLGLGRVVEEQQDLQAALAHYQVAWEIDPRRRDLREHVSRLSQQVYGEDGRLYLTRAALASLHFHAGRWDRAISEAAQVLQEQRGRVDVQIRMAEALWRRGDDPQALQVSGTVLRSMPSAVVPLLIQADIHRRQGNEAEAHELLAQARAIDPAGVRAADLVIVGQEDQSEFLLVEEVPTIDERVLTEPAAGHYTPAPDFMTEETPAPTPTPEPESEPEPFVEQQVSESPASAEPEAAPPADFRMPDIEDTGVQPFRWEDIDDSDLEASDLPEDHPAEQSPPPEPEQPAAEDTVSFELFSDEELDRARPSTDRLPGYTGVLRSLEGEGMRPFDPSNPDDEPASSQPEAPEEAEPAESTWDEVSADWTEPEPEEMPDTDVEPSEPAPDTVEPMPETPEKKDELDPFDLDWNEVDREIEQAIPGEIPRGYTSELRALDETGVEPFSFDDEHSEEQEYDFAAEDSDTEEFLSDVPASEKAPLLRMNSTCQSSKRYPIRRLPRLSLKRRSHCRRSPGRISISTRNSLKTMAHCRCSRRSRTRSRSTNCSVITSRVPRFPMPMIRRRRRERQPSQRGISRRRMNSSLNRNRNAISTSRRRRYSSRRTMNRLQKIKIRSLMQTTAKAR
jgi:tetratricopeptide (TPR) repeat protein